MSQYASYFFYFNFSVIYIYTLIVNNSTINLLYSKKSNKETANFYTNSYFLQMIKENSTSTENLHQVL